MIHPIKWIESVDSDEFVSQVAAAAVSERLFVVSGYLRLAVKHPGADAEHVHQLRVATRRAQVALDIFSESFSNKRVRWFKKQLRTLRRAAGEARNLDVLIAQLKTANKKRKPTLALATVQRRKMQKSLSKLYKRLKHEEFEKRSQRIAKKARWRGAGDEPTFAEVARIKLRPKWEEFSTAAAADLSDINALHRLRILGKKLRYCMEPLATTFDQSFREELYPILGEVQKKIGIINDHATAKKYFDSWAAQADESSHAEILQLIDLAQQECDRSASEFQDWWTEERLADMRRRFDAALTSPAP